MKLLPLAALLLLSGIAGVSWSQPSTTGTVFEYVRRNLTTGRTGVGTTAPATTLDVNGSAQFGSGVTKSTFSTTGSLNLALNADLILTGPTAFINTASSITGGAFFGDGSNLTGVSGLTANNTWTGGQTWTAPSTFTGTAFFGSSVTISGTLSITSVKSTYTIVTSDILQTNTMGAALPAFSTISFTSNGTLPIRICLTVTPEVDNTTVSFNPLMDGAYVENFTASRVFITSFLAVASTTRVTVQRCYKTKAAVSAGVHNFTVTMESGSASHGTKCSVSLCELSIEESPW